MNLIIAFIITLVMFCLFFWLCLKLIEAGKLKKQKRRYDKNEYDDKGRKSDGRTDAGIGYRETTTFNPRESSVQDINEYAKRELLQRRTTRECALIAEDFIAN